MKGAVAKWQTDEFSYKHYNHFQHIIRETYVGGWNVIFLLLFIIFVF